MSIPAPDESRRVTLDEFVKAVRRFRVRDVLLATNATWRNLSKDQQQPFHLDRKIIRGRQSYTQTLIFGPQTLAFIAKQAIIHGSEYRSSPVGDAEYMELIDLHGNLDDAFVNEEETTHLGAFAFLLRTAWEQFTFQDPIGNLIPRYYTIFKTMNELDERRVVDVPAQFLAKTGLSIEEFMTLGVAAWSLADAHSLFFERVFTETEVKTIALKAADGRLAKFLEVLSADYARFEEESRRFALDATLAKTEFNALRTYPIIRLRAGELTAPVPQLVVERATRGVFYILQDALMAAKGNPFKEQFGRDFERYVGFLLQGAYGGERVIHEPVYDKEHKHGPDWLVRDGSTMLIIECTGSGLTLEAKTAAQFDQVVKDVARIYAERIAKFAEKVEALKSGRAGVDCSGVDRFVPVIVTHETLYIEPAVRAFVREALEGHDEMFEQVRLLDIGDIEAVTSWPHLSFVELLDEWREVYKTEGQSFGVFLFKKAEQEGLEIRHPYLTKVFEVTLPHFSGHLDCGERFASERGVQDGHAIPSRVSGAGGGVGTAA